MVAEEVGRRAIFTLGEVRDRFEEMIARVESGETIAIMREGRVVAELLPESEAEFAPDGASDPLARFREERAKWEPINATLDELLEWRREGLR